MSHQSITGLDNEFDYADGILYPPRTLSLHLTDKCNSRCIFCGEDSHSSSIDTVQTSHLLDFLNAHDPENWTAVNIHGGEPTIRPDFLEILSSIRKKRFKKIILQTNAIMMGVPAFSQRVIDIGIDIYTVGFHGHDGTLMDSLTRLTGSFEKIIRGIRSIKDKGGYLRTTTVVCTPNYRHLLDICKRCVSENVDHINLSAMQPGGSAFWNLDSLLVRYDECRPFIEEAIEYALANNKIVTLEGFPLCAVPRYSHLYVDWTRQRLKVLYRGMKIDNFNEFLTITIRAKGEKCTSCPLSQNCVGVYNDYIKINGWKGLCI
jgi:MoaA/NifB/PqqE/SkfB family radical SAM enzyme